MLSQKKTLRASADSIKTINKNKQSEQDQALDQLFRSKVLAHLRFNGGISLIQADIIYKDILISQCREPALLHKIKLNCGKYWDACNFSTSWEDLKKQYRVYNPAKHTWNFNSVWCLAHIHAANQFMIISEVNFENIMRKGDQTSYSAFAKEITLAMMAGYQVKSVTYKNILLSRVIILAPTKTQEEALNLTIADCKADDAACTKGIDEFFKSMIEYYKKKQSEVPAAKTNPAMKESLGKDREEEINEACILSKKLKK